MAINASKINSSYAQPKTSTPATIVRPRNGDRKTTGIADTTILSRNFKQTRTPQL